VIDLLASSLIGENRQVIVIHYNVTGANGKTKLFELIKLVFGDLYMKCQSTVLNRASITSPSAPNEELMSMKGRRIVVVSEPSSQLKFSGSMIKELTGSDEQSSRANYGKKTTFVFNGIPHVLCNKIPEFDDMDGGMARRP
jgi:phage/plasmid-associated DNA primase